MDEFVHLHGHSEYSALDGFSQVTKLAKRVKELNQPAIALTEHGNINGGLKFFNECKEVGVKPIMGIEAYLSVDYSKVQPPYHITLLAKNNMGWQALLKLYKISYENFYYKPRISFKDLFEYGENLIVLSGCPSGILSKHILRKEIDKAKENLDLFKDKFKDQFYIEIMNHDLSFQRELNYNLEELAKDNEINCVGTNDYHYILKEDAKFQEYLLCDQFKKTVNEERKIGLDTEEFYIKSRKEMLVPEEYCDMALEVADRCEVEIKKNGWLLPKIQEEKDEMVSLIHEGLNKYKLWDNKIYMERLKKEFKVIEDANLMGYFLVVQDYINYAKSNNILVGPGRGSVGGSLLAYLIGIHSLDPIKHKLLFSRFYNAGRKESLPDIDVDFPEKRIDEIRKYIQKKWGKEKVSHIGTFTYLQKKSALKLICRVLGIDFKTANEYSSIINDENKTKALCNSNSTFKDLVEKAQKMEKIATHSSIHAAGLIISPVDLEEIIPVRKETTADLYVSSWDMHDIEKMGLIKFDCLSVGTLDVIEDTINSIEGLKIEDIPLDDQEAFDLISRAENTGIFQLGSEGISQVASRIRINSIDDIATVCALYRPGPIYSGLHTKYINRKSNVEEVSYAHPLLEPVLKDTYGIFVYQEQVIESVMVLANFSETEADLLRKAIGKKLPKLMQEQKEKFLKGCMKNKVNNKTAESIWKEIQEFAEYSFNRAHSVGYAYISYYTAYLKAHYPVDFMAALLNNNYSKNDKLKVYLQECERMGIKVLPPSISKGDYDFKNKEGKIFFGVKGINGIGEKTAKEIFNNEYDNFYDFVKKNKPSSDTLVALAEAGAFDEFGYNRNEIIQSAGDIANTIKSIKRRESKKARSLFGNEEDFQIPQKTKELPYDILALKEYERLNTYLKYDPIKGLDLVTPEEIEGEVFIEAYLAEVKEHITKKKATMAYLTLSTKLGQIEGVLFPHLYIEKESILRPGNIFAIEGTGEDGIKIIIKDIWRKQ